jgi:serine-type D-Ala-D-Ala carboxypeptidase/endopeptidase (penicillin-binding protein 4)
MVSRRSFLSSVLASPLLAAAPAAWADLQRAPRPVLRPGSALPAAIPGLDELIGTAALGGDISFAVADATTGAVLESRAAQKTMPPASVAKALTALYALDTLGAQYRFTTRLLATGPVKDGVLQGDLVLVGGGDPTLDTDALGDMAVALKRLGVTRVAGRFLVDARALPCVHEIDPDQSDYAGYNPAICGLNLNYNRVYFEWEKTGTDYRLSMDARGLRYKPAVKIARIRIDERRTPVFTWADRQGGDDWSVARRALGKKGGRWLPVRRPELYCGEVFASLAREQGIALSDAKLRRATAQGQVPGGKQERVLLVHSSEPLEVILRNMLRYSTNLTAEVLGLTATGARGRVVGGLKASCREMNTWARQNYALRQIRLVDHSGLGTESRISAQDMVRVLALSGPDGVLRPMLKPLALKDAKGRPVKDHPIRVEAKTGTLDFVSALAGYALGPDGRALAFAIFSGDVERRAAARLISRDTRPEGARTWNRRARKLQQALIERWAGLYGSNAG